MISRYGLPTLSPETHTSEGTVDPKAKRVRSVTSSAASTERIERVSIASLALATKPSSPLQVPPHNVIHKNQANQDHYAKNLLRGTRVEEHLLRDEHGQYYILGDVIFSDSAGAVRGMRKPDQDISQVYIVKEIAYQSPEEGYVLTPAHGVRTEKLPNQTEQATAREVNIQAAIRHALTPHFQIHTGDRVFLAMPQMASDAHEILRHLRQPAGRDNAQETMPLRLAMAHTMLSRVSQDLVLLHQKGYAHLDVKPENMLLRQDGDLHLADFGHATEQIAGQQHASDTLLGSSVFRAPEVRVGASFDGTQADMWSLGVSALKTLYGQNPFDPAAQRQDVPDRMLSAPHDKAIASNADLSFVQAWGQAASMTLAWLKAGRPGARPQASHSAVEQIIAHIDHHAPHLLAMVLAMLEVNPERRATAQQVVGWLQRLPPSAVPPAAPLLRALRSQTFPVVNAIARDGRLSQIQPGERAPRTAGLRRANSTETLLRPFVSPFLVNDAVAHAAQARDQAAWHASPQFAEVQRFLQDQDARLYSHLGDVPDALDRMERAGDAMAMALTKEK